jgi:hypothetical protein
MEIRCLPFFCEILYLSLARHFCWLTIFVTYQSLRKTKIGGAKKRTKIVGKTDEKCTPPPPKKTQLLVLQIAIGSILCLGFRNAGLRCGGLVVRDSEFWGKDLMVSWQG